MLCTGLLPNASAEQIKWLAELREIQIRTADSELPYPGMGTFHESRTERIVENVQHFSGCPSFRRSLNVLTTLE
jgi:hypothetical protein